MARSRGLGDVYKRQAERRLDYGKIARICF
jgi:hypothetical protein